MVMRKMNLGKKYSQKKKKRIGKTIFLFYVFFKGFFLCVISLIAKVSHAEAKFLIFLDNILIFVDFFLLLTN